MPKDDGASPSRRAVVQRLESLQRAGVTHLPKRRARAKTTEAEVAAPTPSPAAARKQVAATASSVVTSPPVAVAPASAVVSGTILTGPFTAAPLPANKRLAALSIIQQEVAGCQRCGDLASTRTQTVFGVGNLNTRLCFVGEAPGADEDAQGIPFVGRAGQLLTKIIEACTLTRDEVYILNVLKCRPPGNRTPEPEEIAHCRGYLDRQLEIIRPEYICCLGAVAARTVLDSTLSIGQLRGKFHLYRGIPVLCTYHPSYLLRNPPAKRDVWEDMKLLMRRMGIDVEQAKASG
jgi:DNA polymerase